MTGKEVKKQGKKAKAYATNLRKRAAQTVNKAAQKLGLNRLQAKMVSKATKKMAKKLARVWPQKLSYGKRRIAKPIKVIKGASPKMKLDALLRIGKEHWRSKARKKYKLLQGACKDVKGVKSKLECDRAAVRKVASSSLSRIRKASKKVKSGAWSARKPKLKAANKAKPFVGNFFSFKIPKGVVHAREAAKKVKKSWNNFRKVQASKAAKKAEKWVRKARGKVKKFVGKAKQEVKRTAALKWWNGSRKAAKAEKRKATKVSRKIDRSVKKAESWARKVIKNAKALKRAAPRRVKKAAQKVKRDVRKEKSWVHKAAQKTKKATKRLVRWGR